jgi:hypothetical protein
MAADAPSSFNSPLLLDRPCLLLVFAASSRETQMQIQRIGDSLWWQRRFNELAATNCTWQHGQQYGGWQWLQLLRCYMAAMVQAYQAVRLALFMQTVELQQQTALLCLINSQLMAQQALTVELLLDKTGLSCVNVMWLLQPEDVKKVRVGWNSITACDVYVGSSAWYTMGWQEHYNARSADEEDPGRLLDKLEQLSKFASTVCCKLETQQRMEIAPLMDRLATVSGARESGVYLQLFELVVHTTSTQALVHAHDVCQRFELFVQLKQQEAVLHGQAVQLDHAQLQLALKQNRELAFIHLEQLQQQEAQTLAAAQPLLDLAVTQQWAAAAAQQLVAIAEVQALLLKQAPVDWQQQQAGGCQCEPELQQQEVPAYAAAADPAALAAVVADCTWLQGCSSSGESSVTAANTAVTSQQQVITDTSSSSIAYTAAAGTNAADVSAAAEQGMELQKQVTPVDAAAAVPTAADAVVTDGTLLQDASSSTESSDAATETAAATVVAAAVAAEASAGAISNASDTGCTPEHKVPAVPLPDTAADTDASDAASAASKAAAAEAAAAVGAVALAAAAMAAAAMAAAAVAAAAVAVAAVAAAAAVASSSLTISSSTPELQLAILPDVEADSSSTDTAAAAGCSCWQGGSSLSSSNSIGGNPDPQQQLAQPLLQQRQQCHQRWRWLRPQKERQQQHRLQ